MSTAYPDFLDHTTKTPACRADDVDPDLFFPERSEAWKAQEAKAICDRCPLLTECHTWALAQSPTQLYGVWGGTSDYDRIRHHRGKPRRKPAGAGDHHDVIARMRAQDPPATYAEIGKAIGYGKEAVRSYWQHRKQQTEAVAA